MRHHNVFQPGYSRDESRELPADVRLLNLTATVLFGIAAVLLLAMALTWLVRLSVFDVSRIRVEGDVTRNSVSTIRANALPQMAGSYFTMNLVRGQRAFEAVPWVRQAVVSRVWPNRLAVRLEEHHAAALWSVDEGGDLLVNTYGEVFQANVGDVEDEGLPTLQGPPGSAPLVLAVYKRLNPLFDRMALKLGTLSLSDRGSWRAEFDGGAEVELGRGTEEELATRVDRFVDTVSQVIAKYQRPLVFADLRHHEGYALRLKGITTTSIPQVGGAARN